MGKNKKFSKKSSITFKLVHRSQKDPLIADERAPQHVLHYCGDTKGTHKRPDRDTDVETQRDEQKKYGIYFDDDYNYLQHLRDVNYINNGNYETQWDHMDTDKTKKKETIKLPSSLFSSAVEEKVGMLNKGVLPVGPQPDWDPDVVAAMDDDFNYDDPNNQIDDDFLMQAEGVSHPDQHVHVGDDDDSEWEDISDDDDDDDDDGNRNLSDISDRLCESEMSFNKEETKSHFTNYSLTSAVIRRNDGLRTLDERFEALYEKEYANECEIGSLDFEDINGYVDPNKSKVMEQLIEEFAKSRDERNVHYVPSANNRYRNDEENDQMNRIEIYDTRKGTNNDRLDCESILSTYSNLYNHPKIIREEKKIKINAKLGIPIGVLDRPGLTAKKLAQLDAINGETRNLNDNRLKSVGSRRSKLSELSLRPQNETRDERKLRKSNLKEYRKERRFEKKLNKLAFKSEHLRQEKEVLNIQTNLKGVKLI